MLVKEINFTMLHCIHQNGAALNKTEQRRAEQRRKYDRPYRIEIITFDVCE